MEHKSRKKHDNVINGKKSSDSLVQSQRLALGISGNNYCSTPYTGGAKECDPTILKHEQKSKEDVSDLFSNERLTLWLSTKGAHTPLHYDSYGCNVVTQVKGTKCWKIWAPNSSNSSQLSSDASDTCASQHPDKNNSCCLQNLTIPKTRIPYEESTVYSTYDPRMHCENSTGFIPPTYTFNLKEGDVLFIPKHFWHFVETTSELSLSVNLWLPHPMPDQSSYNNCKIKEEGEVVCADSVSIADEKEEESTTDVTDSHSTAPPCSKKDDTEPLQKRQNATKKCKRGGVAEESALNASKRSRAAVSDSNSRLSEAATRFLFGCLKDAISQVTDTDDVRAGWLAPSEIGGTLDYSVSSDEEVEDDEEEEEMCVGIDETGSDQGGKNDSCPTADIKAMNRMTAKDSRDLTAYRLRAENTQLHLRYLRTTFEEESRNLPIDEIGTLSLETSFEDFLKKFTASILHPDIVEKCISASMT